MIHNIIEDDIGAVVAAMRTAQEGPPYYMFGHLIEIVNRIAAKAKNAAMMNKRYPFIALKLDTPVEVGSFLSYNLNIAIINSTLDKYNAEERLENIFKPILLPLYERFMLEIRKSGKFFWDTPGKDPEHTMVLRYFWGTEQGAVNVKNKFEDPIDAIEILNLKLKSLIKTC